ncbi:hypothetical protein PGT21_027461 [Puccinia graminis f. sp. tritici]|uniref:Uncharacterized protein n=1 Tax=Puccinia graminis f. sp. tritici TaxID=56615 RepID=A0A5B0LP36_PUCGR|nr:hypothetical protein PGT21_027461 [Puccinia graminis f. sp. tritici]KAA1128393.1 hypothetical protein PGTUg99_020732 [Puccinia graminis f. sp. tritici]
MLLTLASLEMCHEVTQAEELHPLAAVRRALIGPETPILVRGTPHMTHQFMWSLKAQVTEPAPVGTSSISDEVGHGGILADPLPMNESSFGVAKAAEIVVDKPKVDP